MESLDLFSQRAPRPGHHPFSREALAGLLNAPQLEAVMHPAAPLIVVAGAGSGKTRVITYRLARLLGEGADPRRMFIVTFTNKAAAELRERVAKLLGGDRDVVRRLWLGTFHGLSARLLRQYGQAVGVPKDFVIYDDDDQKRLMARVLADLGISERLFPVRQVLSAIDRAKNQGIEAERFQAGDYFEDVVGKAYTEYEKRLAAAGAVDFGGLLLSALQLCRSESPVMEDLAHRFDHMLVDEFQDTNLVQYRLVRFLSAVSGSITVVGDEDQSIYGWRGADIRNILDFERDNPGAGLVKLEENYRSTGNVLRAANAIIARNKERRPKRLFTSADAGSPIVDFEGETERDEAEFVASTIDRDLMAGAMPRDFAIFYRTNGQSRVLEESLRGRDIAYVVVGGTRFYDRAEIKNLLAYLRALSNPDDSIGLARIVNVPARGIGDGTMDKVAAMAHQRGLTLWQALEAVVADDALLGSGPRKKIEAFVALMKGLRQEAVGLPPADLAERVLEASGYRDALAAEASIEAEGRLENLLELVAQMREYEREAEEPNLAGFLEKVALVADVDSYDPDRGAVSMMTVHTAKGLEFPQVFVTGLEEGVFPHQRSIDDDSAIEEERRLCYVAVTRAMKKLHLSHVRRRRLSGQVLGGLPSRFLKDLPQDCFESIVQPRPTYYDVDTEGAGPWGGRWNRGGYDASERVSGRGRAQPAWSRGTTPEGNRPAAPVPGGQGRGGNITVHYDNDQPGSELGLRVGARLRHPKFGAGEVRAWQGEGADLKVTLRFPGGEVKTILARFLTKP